MAANECLDAVRRALGRDASDEELDDLFTALRKREAYKRAQGVLDPAGEAAEEVARDLRIMATIEKRNAAINYLKRAEKVSWVRTNFGNNLAEGLEAILVGVNRAKTGARNGAAQLQATLVKSYHAGFVADVERTGHMPVFTSGVLDRDIARALWAMGKEDAPAVHGRLQPEAVEVAKVIAKWQEVARTDANKAGAWVGKLDGYITKQSHDSEKIRRAGYEAWKESAISRFDLQRMVAESGSEAEAMLRGIYTDLASGNHMHLDRSEPTPFKGPANLAKKVSQSRTIHFKDADSWANYNQEYGTGSLRESVMQGLAHSGQSTGLMQALGTNPKANFEAIKAELVDAAKREGKVDQVAALGEKRTALENYMAAVDGTMNIPGSQLWARRMANVRAWETMAKLGGMVLSQLNDIAIYGSGTSYQGRGFLSGMAQAVGGLGRDLKSAETRELAASLGVTFDNMAGEISRVGSFAEAGGMNKAVQLFMKLNLAQWWTDKMRASAALGMSHHMALQAGKGFDQLGPEYQRVLSLYGIAEKQWDHIRASSAKNVDGNAYIVPENVADKDAQAMLRTYLTDQTSFLQLEPDAKTRAIMLQGTRPGTWTGEGMRFLTQFKSFTGAYMQKIMGRELLGRGYEGDSLLKALTAGNGEMQGLAQLIVMSTLMGYGSMALKDLAKGRTPRDPSESPEMALKVFAAAMVQGGGAGIYGDFLFGEASRFGSGTIESIAGPVPSAAGRIIDLYHKGMRGEDVAASALREVMGNTPFLNLFYTRAALDYLVVYRIQEMMNPGYLGRMERRIQQDNGQTFLLRPSEVAR